MKITALIGYPTAHSVSPTLFSIYAKAAKIEYSHLKLDVKPTNLVKILKAIKTLGFSGLNVTLPYKSEIIKYLDHIDSGAEKIGAVNTIVVRKGELCGYNTDSYGAITAIKKHTPKLFGKKTVVLGTGGAARAVISELLKNKARVTVVYREPQSERTKSLVKDFSKNVDFMVYDNAKLIKTLAMADIICNTTSCGMTPKYDESPISLEVLRKASFLSSFDKKLFFDTIFNPYESRFLKYAKKLGADTQGGTEMMIYQGVKAFKLWTGKKVDQSTIQVAKEVLKKELLKRK